MYFYTFLFFYLNQCPPKKSLIQKQPHSADALSRRTAGLTSMPWSRRAMRSFSLMDLCCVSVSWWDRDTFSSFRCSRRPAWVICPTFREKTTRWKVARLQAQTQASPSPRLPGWGFLVSHGPRWLAPRDSTTQGLTAAFLPVALSLGPAGSVCLKGGRQPEVRGPNPQGLHKYRQGTPGSPAGRDSRGWRDRDGCGCSVPARPAHSPGRPRLSSSNGLGTLAQGLTQVISQAPSA